MGKQAQGAVFPTPSRSPEAGPEVRRSGDHTMWEVDCLSTEPRLGCSLSLGPCPRPPSYRGSSASTVVVGSGAGQAHSRSRGPPGTEGTLQWPFR